MAFVVINPDKRPDQPTSVYVMTCGDHVKIGLAVNVAVRLKTIQTSCPLPITIAAELLFAGFATARSIERELHAEFADRRGFGEWFNVPTDEAVSALRRYAVRAYERPPAPPATPPAKVERAMRYTKAEQEFMKAMAF